MLQSHNAYPINIYSQVLTKDSVTVSVDAVVYYRVSNATVSVANVENAHHSTRLLAQTTLRNILGTKNLHEILSDRESISGSMQVRIFHIVFCTLYLTYACMHKKTRWMRETELSEAHYGKTFFCLLCSDGSGRGHHGLGDQGRESGNVSKGNEEFLHTYKTAFLYFLDILILFSLDCSALQQGRETSGSAPEGHGGGGRGSQGGQSKGAFCAAIK